MMGFGGPMRGGGGRFGGRGMEESNVKESFKLSEFFYLVKQTKGYGKEIVFILFFSILQVVSYQILAYSLKFLINDIIPTKEVNKMLLFAAVWIGAFLIHGVFTVIAARVRIFVIRDFIANMRALIIKKLQRIAIRYFDDKGAGKTSAKVLMDMEKLQQFVFWLTNAGLTSILSLFFIVPFLTSINITLTIISFIYIPCIIIVQLLFRKKIMKRSYNLRNKSESLSEKIVEYISGIKQLRSFANEKQYGDTIIEEVEAVRDADIDFSFVMRVLAMIVQFLGEFSMIVLWVSAGIIMIKDPALTLGAVVAYIGLVRQLSQSFHVLFESYNIIISSAPSVNAVAGVLGHDDVEKDCGKNKDFTIDGSVCFDDVHFSYEQREGQNQLTDINITIEKGEKVAVVGHSGAGKSTFVDVLLGFYPIKSGDIRFGEYSMKNLSLRKLRSQISLMCQETFLFNTSIYENIRLARPDASKEDVEKACKQAEIYDFIKRLPEGWDTYVGERGVQLSGGERQRVGLARVFLRDAKIVVLDEPSSSLDVFTEGRFIKTLYSEIEGRTLIIIAHRLSTIRNVDRILVFDNGRIVESGSYNELANKEGGYFNSMVKENLFITESLRPDAK